MVIKLSPKKPSNQTQTPGISPSGTQGEAIASESALIPFIDKLSVVVDLKDDAALTAFRKTAKNINNKTIFQNAGPKAQVGWQRAHRIEINGIDQRPLVQLKIDYGLKAVSKIRVEFNPRKLTKPGLGELDSVLQLLLEGGWDHFVKFGWITRIDVAVDIPNMKMDQFIFLPQLAATEIRWGVGGHLQFFSHGKRKGNQTVAYSVGAKRKSKGQPWTKPRTVRLERRLRFPGKKALFDLGTLPNVFANMAITAMPGPAPGMKLSNWSAFEDSVKVRGVRQALALLPEGRRKLYRDHLKAFPKPWWNPEAMWKGWPKAYLPLIDFLSE